jgi:hypothetical protein
MLGELKKGAGRLASQVKDVLLGFHLNEYLDSLRSLQAFATWTNYNDDGEDTLVEDIDERTGAQLEVLVSEISLDEQIRMRTELAKLGYVIEDPALLTSITGRTSLRMEQVRALSAAGVGMPHEC